MTDVQVTFDISDRSVVISCDHCPFWTGFAFDREEARVRREAHLVRVHGVPPNIAAEARRKAETRRKKRERRQSVRERAEG